MLLNVNNENRSQQEYFYENVLYFRHVYTIFSNLPGR